MPGVLGEITFEEYLENPTIEGFEVAFNEVCKPIKNK